MAAFGIITIILSMLLLSAHVWRLGSFAAALAIALASLLLLIPRVGSARLIQVLLVIGALEWLRTIFRLIGERMDEGLPWLRMSLILGAVLLWTLLSAATFRLPPLARRYGLEVARVAGDGE